MYTSLTQSSLSANSRRGNFSQLSQDRGTKQNPPNLKMHRQLFASNKLNHSTLIIKSPIVNAASEKRQTGDEDPNFGWEDLLLSYPIYWVGMLLWQME